jgi:hypothetical protein
MRHLDFDPFLAGCLQIVFILAGIAEQSKLKSAGGTIGTDRAPAPHGQFLADADSVHQGAVTCV